jgi:hypothetical protein
LDVLASDATAPFGVPRYLAVRLCVPRPSELVRSVAVFTPAELSTEAVPSGTVLSKKSTKPMRTLAGLRLTVAVKETTSAGAGAFVLATSTVTDGLAAAPAGMATISRLRAVRNK